jgi:hypothetical protein
MKRTQPAIESDPAEADNVITLPAVQPLKICVVFDDDASALSAEVLIKHAAPGLLCDVKLFAFDELDPPEPGVRAARNACDSDILVVAVRDDHALPGHVQLWLGLCLGLREQGVGGLLLALIRKADEVADAESSLTDYLKTVAAIGGLEFFPRRAPLRVITPID